MSKQEQPNYVHPASLSDALSAMQERQHSLTIYVEQMCRRIDQLNPRIHAFLPEKDRKERLLAEAASLRNRHNDPFRRPALYGAMVGVKDIFHVEGMVTRAGTQLPPQLFAGDEAKCVTLLRESGALIAGKTVTTEFAYFEPGPTRNPHNPDHTPGGSSSGSAAAVAVGLRTLALGTQTIGSVIRPAAFCGIVGFKPTLDRIPSQGIVYFSRSIDHVGLFTQDIAGMRAAAAVLCDGWRDAPAGAALPVIGVPDGPYLEQTEAGALRDFEELILFFQVGGCIVKRVPAFENIAELNQLHRRLVFAEFAQEHAGWFTEFEALYRSKTVEAIRIGQSVSDDELTTARAHCESLRKELAQTMADNGIDVWACPSATGPAPPGIEATGDPNMNLPWTHAGMPAITVPAGRTADGMPLGLQLVGPFGADEELLGWAEQLSHLIVEPADG